MSATRGGISMQRASKILALLSLVAMTFAAPFTNSALAAPQQISANTGALQTYLVLYNDQTVPADAATTIANAGGTFVYGYSAIGVAIARSDNSAFRANLLKDGRVAGASSTAAFATQLNEDATVDSTNTPVVNTPAPGSDNLSGLQWDMVQIHAPEAHAITGGSPSVLVGAIATGHNYTHP